MINLKKILILIVFSFLTNTVNLNYVSAEEIYELEAEKVLYQKEKNLIIAEKNALAKSGLKKIYADKILYFKDKNIIETYGNSKFEDGSNILTANKFVFFVNQKKIKADQNVYLEDKDNNKFYFDSFEFYQNQNFGTGKNIKSNIDDGSYLESTSGKIDKKTGITTLKNVLYTTCSVNNNKKDNFCPSWSLKSKSVTHDKSKKKIIHRNTFLRIKNIPVLYSPYLSHPDPSVKRQSGFLPPLIKTISNVGRTFRTPYFWAISEDKDLTITPIYYVDEKDAVLTSYRQAFKNGYLNFESGYSGGYKRFQTNSNRTGGSRNYLFLKYQGNTENLIYKENIINFKLERVSQRNFLRINKINTKLFKEDIRSLENSFELNSYSKNKKVKIRTGIYENLDTVAKDKYTYLVPDISFDANLYNLNNFNIKLNSFFQGKNSQSQKEIKFRNLFTMTSPEFFNKKTGLSSQIKANFYNKNIYNNSLNNEQSDNIKNYFTIASENSFYLAKNNENLNQTIVPKIFLKYTTGKMKGSSVAGNNFKYSDIFSMNRTNDVDAPETGLSLGHGFDYTIDKKISNVKKLKTSIGLGQVLRSNKLDKMPVTTSLNNKSSDFTGFVKFDFWDNTNANKKENLSKSYTSNLFKDNNFSLNYNYNLSNDLKKLNKNDITLNLKRNTFSTNITFSEKNDYIGNERIAYFDLKKLFKQNYYLRFESKKDLLNDRSEFHNISFNFENECLISSLTYSKSFYNDKDLSSGKNLIFSIIIKPFGDGIAPDLTNFIN